MLPLNDHKSTREPANLADILAARVFVTFMAGGRDIGHAECTLGELAATVNAWRCGPACRYSPTALVADNCHTYVSRTFPAYGDLFDALPEWKP